MTDGLGVFIHNLMEALKLVVYALQSITFSINQRAVTMVDFLVYSGVVTAVISAIKNMSYYGMFTVEKSKREHMSGRNYSRNKGSE